MCLGDVLARMELFEFFASLMHTFDVRVPENSQLPSLKATTGVTLTPQEFQVRLVQRPLQDSNYEFLNSNSNLRSVGAH